MTKMTKRWEQAAAMVAELSDTDQDAIAEVVMAELASEARWQRLFAASQDVLADLAEEALAAHKEGKTHVLELDDR
jgi:hypothetical protein